MSSIHWSRLIVSLVLTSMISLAVAHRAGWLRLTSPWGGPTAPENVQEAVALAYLYDNRSGWRMNPHTQIHRRIGDSDIRHSTNSDGFLDREHYLHTSYYRIAFVGDSWVEAQQVPETSRFSNLTEDFVYSLSGGSHAVEIMNCGVSNLGTAHEYGIIKHWLLKYRPDEVWVFFSARTDLADNSPLATNPPAGPTYVHEAGSDSRLADIQFGYVQPPAVMNAERTRRYGALLNSYQSFHLEVLPYFYSTVPNPVLDEALAWTFQSFQLIRDVLAANQAQLRVVYLPADFEVIPLRWENYRGQCCDSSRAHLQAEPSRGEQRVAEMMEKLRVPFISLRSLILEKGPESLYADHLTTAGHAEIARMLAQRILDNRLAETNISVRRPVQNRR